jgi:hypothetical protein
MESNEEAAKKVSEERKKLEEVKLTIDDALVSPLLLHFVIITITLFVGLKTIQNNRLDRIEGEIKRITG